MNRSNLRHLSTALAMTMVIGLLCAPVAWLVLGRPGLTLVAASGASILAVALLSDALVWLLRGAGGSVAIGMVCGAACRMAFVLGLMVLATQAAPEQFLGVPKQSIAICLIPFYFGLLAVEVFTAKTILSASPAS
jgi:hypothetical protein